MPRYTPRHAPRHAAPRRSGASQAARTALGRPVLASGVAAAVMSTGALAAALSGGTASADPLSFAVDGVTSSASAEQSKTEQADAVRVAADRRATNAQRSVAVARSAQREKVKAATLAKARKSAAEKAAAAAARRRVIDNARKDPKAAARMLMPEYGFGPSQWSCLERLWIGESGWNYKAANSSSGAYGIPQSLPGSKMASVAGDWRTNPVTQIKWGLDYIKRSYGSPCNALNQWDSRYPHWY
jgi:hypothetical protein